MPHDIQTTNVHISETAADASFTGVMKASADKGGLTVLGVKVFNGGTITDAHLALENWGTAGTAIKAVSTGTVSTQGTAGTAGTVAHAANSPGAAFNNVAANIFVDSDEYLVLRKTGAELFLKTTLMVEWIQGR